MKNQPKKSVFEVKRLVEPFTVEALKESDGTFSGKGMVFNTEHPTSSWLLGPEWKDKVLPGAFEETLAAHAKAGTKPLMLYMHERGNMPGVWNEVKELKSHLAVSGQVSKSAVTASGVTLLELMKMGAMTGLSIGFKPTEFKLDEKKKLREIMKVELREISIVDEPGNGPSRITDIKRDMRGLEAGLRALGLSQTDAKALLAEGFDALRDEDDETETQPEPEAKAEPPAPKPPEPVVESFLDTLRKTLNQPTETVAQKAQRDAEVRSIVSFMKDLTKQFRNS
jgi:HK97 family phage prohead protease